MSAHETEMGKRTHDAATRLRAAGASALRRPNAAGALGLMALAGGALLFQRARPARMRRADDPARNLAAYLREHLAGADAAIRIVGSLRARHDGTREAALFAWLDDQFREDRRAVVAVLAALGASPGSLKRMAGRAAGGVMQAAAGGPPGAMSLFRTLEGLAIAVQGKRCLWRAAQALDLSHHAPRSLAELEARAEDQWERIEACRLDLVSRTFEPPQQDPAGDDAQNHTERRR